MRLFRGASIAVTTDDAWRSLVLRDSVAPGAFFGKILSSHTN